MREEIADGDGSVLETEELDAEGFLEGIDSILGDSEEPPLPTTSGGAVTEPVTAQEEQTPIPAAGAS